MLWSGCCQGVTGLSVYLDHLWGKPEQLYLLALIRQVERLLRLLCFFHITYILLVSFCSVKEDIYLHVTMCINKSPDSFGEETKHFLLFKTHDYLYDQRCDSFFQ